MAARLRVKLTANFERNFHELEGFLDAAGAAQAFDGLLDDLSDTVVPNLERFPRIGRPLLDRPVRSVEVGNALDQLKRRLSAIAGDTGDTGALREYVMSRYLLLYAYFGTTIYLLAIRHHRQLSFDFDGLWLSQDDPRYS